MSAPAASEDFLDQGGVAVLGGDRDTSSEMMGGSPSAAQEGFGWAALTASAGVALGFGLGRQYSGSSDDLSGGGGDKDTSGEMLGGHGWAQSEKGFWAGSLIVGGAVVFGLWLIRQSSMPPIRRPGTTLRAGTGISLAFTMEFQEELEWCWAAVTASVEKFFVRGSSVSQCAVAATQTGLACCGHQRQACDRPETLHEPLDRRHLLDGGPVTAQVDFDEVRDQIDAGRPVAVRVGWLSGGALTSRGHFAAITGYRVTDAGRRMVTVMDPWYGENDMLWDELTDMSGGYLGRGAWTTTYQVQPPR